MKKVSYILGIIFCQFLSQPLQLSAQNSIVLNGAFIVLNGGVAANNIDVVINQPNPLGIVRLPAGGHINSENQFNIVKWLTSSSTGNYVFPFGVGGNAADYIPFIFNKTAGNNNVSVSTWGTNVPNNPKPVASNVGPVTNMIGVPDSVKHAIDRFWDIQAPATTADLTFSYLGSENTTINPTDPIFAQHWNGTTWDPQVGPGISGVTAGIGISDVVTGQTTFSPWALTICATTSGFDTLAICQNDSVFVGGAYQTAAGTYIDTLVNGNYMGCDSIVKTTIEVNPLPVLAINPVSPLCIDAAVATLVGSPTGGTFTGTSVTGTSFNPATAGVGIHTITYTYTDTNSCSASITIGITVNPLPTPSITPVSALCLDAASVNLVGSPTGGTFTGTGVTGTSFNPATAGAGIHTITYTSTDTNSCSASTTTSITVNTLPTFTVNSTNPSCGNNDGKIVITPSSGVTITDYSINNGTDIQPVDSFPNLLAGSYTVYVKDNNGCVATQLESLSNAGAPVIDNIATTQTSCTVADGTITITASGGTDTLQYSTDNGGTFQSSGSFTGLGAGSYDIVVKDDNGCEANGTAIINQMNAPDLTLVSSNNITCNGDNDGSIEVATNGGTMPYNYGWFPNVSTSDSAVNLSAGDYTVTVIDGAGCTDTLLATISEPDTIAIVKTITNSDCGQDNGSISLQVTGGDGNYTYAWNPNISTSATTTGLASGTYNVTVTDGNGCAQTGSYNVGMNDSFSLNAVPDYVTIKKGESIDIHLTIDASITVDSIIWSPAEGLSCTDCENPVASPEISTTYYVVVTSTDGCSSMDSVIVTVKPPCAKIYIPTSFSPNGDGMNDLQCVMGECIATMEFFIYDRWGEVVFQTTDLKQCWDGMFRGKLVQSGVYVYKLKATLESGEKIEESGNINVIR